MASDRALRATARHARRIAGGWAAANEAAARGAAAADGSGGDGMALGYTCRGKEDG